MSGFGAGNVSHLFGQQGSMPFPTTGTSQNFPPLASAWNPYQGLFPSYNFPLGGSLPMASNPTVGSGYPPIPLDYKVFLMVQVFIRVIHGNLVPLQI